MGTCYWIWYQGDFELYHAMKQNFSRIERGYGWPAFWKSEGFRNRVVFRKEFHIEKETTFCVYSKAVGFVLVDEQKYPFGKTITCPPGKGSEILSFDYDDHQEITWEKYGETLPPDKSISMLRKADLCRKGKPLEGVNKTAKTIVNNGFSRKGKADGKNFIRWKPLHILERGKEKRQGKTAVRHGLGIVFEL